MSTASQYAQEIKDQLYWVKHNGLPIAWSWGPNKWVFGEGKLELSLDGEKFERKSRVWLRFNVSGRIFKGLVYVILTGMDDYTICLVKQKRKKNEFGLFDISYTLVDERGGILADELAWSVDRLVETKSK